MSISELLGTGSIEKAKFSSPDSSKLKLECRFNPSSLKITRKRTWTDGKQFNASYPSLQYGGSSHDTLDFSIVLDETEPYDLSGMAATAASLNPVMNLGPMAKMMGLVNEDSVEDDLETLYKMTTPVIVSEKGGDFVRPPLVTFAWKDFYFNGAIENLVVNIVLFDEKGRPKRAKVDITMKGRLATAKATDVEKATAPEKAKKA